MISRLSRCLSASLVLLALVTIARADTPYNPPVRIKLSRFFPVGTQQIIVSCSGPFTVLDPNGSPVVQAPTGASYSFTDQSGAKVAIAAVDASSDSEDSESGLTMADVAYTVHGGPGSITTVTLATAAAVPHHYRGDLLILPGLCVINTLPLEDYLKGVLKPEIGAGAPVEALKAQAVAARTYTVRNLGKMALVGADMDDTTQTQSYLGADGETPAIALAISDTAGQVLLFDGTLIDAVYSTDCGGVTAEGSPAEPYLAPVQDPECSLEPPWEVDITSDELAALLPGAADAVSVHVTNTDLSGRVTQLKVTDGVSSKLISGSQLRRILGYDKVKSTLFKLTKNSDGSYHMVGQGWGHGLGMCQRGAIYMAQHASAYTDILKHYYTGATISELDPTMLSVAPAGQIISASTQLSTQTGP